MDWNKLVSVRQTLDRARKIAAMESENTKIAKATKLFFQVRCFFMFFIILPHPTGVESFLTDQLPTLIGIG